MGASVRNEMTAVAWTAIGLLAATLLGSLHYLGSRIDALGVSMNTRMDGLESRMDGLGSRMDGLESRIDALAARLDARLDALAVRLDAHIEHHAG